MDNWERLTIHIGMPKCASTSLQCGLFSTCSIHHYLGPTSPHFPEQLELKHRYLMAISGSEEIRWQKIKDEVKAYIMNYFDHNERCVISDEGIAHGYFGGVPEACGDRLLIAKRYREMFPGAQILMLIRNQYDYLKSHFGEWNRRNFIDYPDFHRWLDECLNLRQNLITNPLFLPEYFEIYQVYSELFGVERVKVLALETYAGCPEELFKEVAGITGIQVTDSVLSRSHHPYNTRTTLLNKRLAKLDFHYPFLRKLVPRSLAIKVWDSISRISTTFDAEYSDEERASISEVYARGNRQLAEVTGLQLSSLGYPI